MIIGLSGLVGSGKDSTANIIIKNHDNWVKTSFAKAMKDAVAGMYGLPRELLEGDTLESREWREQPNEFWSEKLGIEGLTPRKILQNFGTELVRKNVDSSFWVFRSEYELQKLEAEGKNVLITDVRFPNEAEMIKAHGGQIWHVFCGDVPEWFENYRDKRIVPAGIHESEYKWAEIQPDMVIHPPYKDLALLEKMVEIAYKRNIDK